MNKEELSQLKIAEAEITALRTELESVAWLLTAALVITNLTILTHLFR